MLGRARLRRSRSLTCAETPRETASRARPGIAAWFDWDGGEGVTFELTAFREKGARPAFFRPTPPFVLATSSHPTRSDAAIRIHLRVGDDVRGRTEKPRPLFSSTTSGQVLTSVGWDLSSSSTPTLNEDGRIDQMILNGVASELRLEQIARELSAGFPHRFVAWTDALTRVSQVSSRYL